MELRENITVNGWDFELVENDVDDIFYQCRGKIMYDDQGGLAAGSYHDEVPEPSLWQAAEELEKQLFKDGIACEAHHSEKGWVEVTIIVSKYGKNNDLYYYKNVNNGI